MKPILRALRLFANERGLWRFALVPFAWAALAFVLVILVLTGSALELGERLGGHFGGALGVLLSVALMVALGGGIYLSLVALISGFGFDRLSTEVERRAFGQVVGQRPTLSRGIFDGVARAFLAGLLGLLGLCLAWTVVGPWIVASLLMLVDSTAPALLRRGVGFGRQFGVARRLPDALSFAAIAGFIALIPVMNVIAFPILVAAGTLMVAERPFPDSAIL